GVDADPLRQGVWEKLHGMDRFEARKLVVQIMEEGGFLARVEPHRHAVPHGDRSGVPIEPFLTDQWYVNAAELAKPAIESVRAGRRGARGPGAGARASRVVPTRAGAAVRGGAAGGEASAGGRGGGPARLSAEGRDKAFVGARGEYTLVISCEEWSSKWVRW